MKLTIRDKSFEINFVNNWCRERYQDMIDKVEELGDLPDQLDEISRRDDIGDRAKLRLLKDLKREKRGLSREIVDIRGEILKELLETNGYEYDQKWWSRKTDADDLNEFILSCLQKDLKADGSKKK